MSICVQFDLVLSMQDEIADKAVWPSAHFWNARLPPQNGESRRAVKPAGVWPRTAQAMGFPNMAAVRLVLRAASFSRKGQYRDAGCAQFWISRAALSPNSDDHSLLGNIYSGPRAACTASGTLSGGPEIFSRAIEHFRNEIAPQKSGVYP